MNRTRAWRRHQRERIRRRRTHYNTVRWAHELGDGRRIDIATEHPACTCHQCRNRRGPSLQDRKAAVPLGALSVEPVLLELSYVEPHFVFGDEEEVDPLDGEMLPRVAYSREVLTLPVVYVEPRFSWSDKSETDLLDEI